MNETVPQENPLINNKKLRQLYVAMVETRILADHVTRPRSGRKGARSLRGTRGQEACWVSTAIELRSGDLVSDTQQDAMDPIAARQGAMLKRVNPNAAKANRANRGSDSRQMPGIDAVKDRLHMVLGAALAFKKLKQPNLVLAYVRRGDAAGASWKRVLTLAAKLELPVIFVVLPELGGGKKRSRPGHVSAKAGSCGVPGIPVDSSDAVALYRVAQESIGRIRGGGGPVAIECVALRTDSGVPDPIAQLRSFLLTKKICTPAWLDFAGHSVGGRFAKATEQSSVGV